MPKRLEMKIHGTTGNLFFRKIEPFGVFGTLNLDLSSKGLLHKAKPIHDANKF